MCVHKVNSLVTTRSIKCCNILKNKYRNNNVEKNNLLYIQCLFQWLSDKSSQTLNFFSLNIFLYQMIRDQMELWEPQDKEVGQGKR